MSEETPFTVQVSNQQRRRLEHLAKQEGVTWERYLMKHLMTRLDGLTKGSGDELDPKAAGDELGVSKWTILRYMKQGRFPNAYYLSAHMVRIPRSDIEAMKQDRVAMVAA